MMLAGLWSRTRLAAFFWNCNQNLAALLFSVNSRWYEVVMLASGTSIAFILDLLFSLWYQTRCTVKNVFLALNCNLTKWYFFAKISCHKNEVYVDEYCWLRDFSALGFECTHSYHLPGECPETFFQCTVLGISSSFIEIYTCQHPVLYLH